MVAEVDGEKRKMQDAAARAAAVAPPFLGDPSDGPGRWRLTG